MLISCTGLHKILPVSVFYTVTRFIVPTGCLGVAITGYSFRCCYLSTQGVSILTFIQVLPVSVFFGLLVTLFLQGVSVWQLQGYSFCCSYLSVQGVSISSTRNCAVSFYRVTHYCAASFYFTGLPISQLASFRLYRVSSIQSYTKFGAYNDVCFTGLLITSWHVFNASLHFYRVTHFLQRKPVCTGCLRLSQYKVTQNYNEVTCVLLIQGYSICIFGTIFVQGYSILRTLVCQVCRCSIYRVTQK